jgi:EpsI family protein
VLLVGATVLVTATANQPATAAPAIVEIPRTLDEWKGIDAGPLDPDTERVVAADVVLNRTYSAGDDAIGLYVAYYTRQGPAAGIHSPLHCLPGTGWDILSNETADVDLGDGRIVPIRRVLAQKTNSRVLVMYWYAIHGRMIANEFMSRWQLLNDRIRLGRNDGALVRLVVPVTDSEAASEARGAGFIRALVPYL